MLLDEAIKQEKIKKPTRSLFTLPAIRDSDITTFFGSRFEKLLFTGNMGNQAIGIGQTNEQHELFKKGIFVGEVYIAGSATHYKIIGLNTKSTIEAYSLSLADSEDKFYIDPREEDITDIGQRILAQKLGLIDKIIPGRITCYDEMFCFLQDNSAHEYNLLRRNQTNEWFGEEIDHRPQSDDVYDINLVQRWE